MKVLRVTLASGASSKPIKKWYTGRSSASKVFDLKTVYSDHNHMEWGPGFYFSADYDEASDYATGKHGHVLCVTIVEAAKNKFIDGPYSETTLKKFLSSIPNIDKRLAVAKTDISTYLSNRLKRMSLFDAFVDIWWTVYKNQAKATGELAIAAEEYLHLITKLGYVGAVYKAHSGEWNCLVYDPKVIMINQ